MDSHSNLKNMLLSRGTTTTALSSITIQDLAPVELLDESAIEDLGGGVRGAVRPPPCPVMTLPEPPAGGPSGKGGAPAPRSARVVSCHRAKYGPGFSLCLPESGVSKEDCGQWLKRVGCPVDREHFHRVVKKHCDDPLCPVCADHWAGREAVRVTERVLQAELLWHERGMYYGPIKHVMLSPPQEEAKALIESKEGYKKLHSQANRMLKKAGLVAGCTVFHGFRWRNDVPYLSPHFHILGYGYLVDSSDFYRKTGWVYKNLGARDSIPGTIKYLLSHCALGYEDGKRAFHALTWFGKLAYNQIVIASREIEWCTVPCPVCGEDLHEFSEDGSEDLGIFLVKVVRTRWRLRKGLIQQVLPPPA